jgi:endonuclease I
MKKLIFATLFFFSFSCYFIYSQIPPGYYDPAAGLYGTALQSALHNIIKNHTTVDYSTLTTYFESTDKKSNNTVWDMYSDIPGGNPPYTYTYTSSDECGNYNGEGDCFNKEHSWPKSWFGGEVMPMYSDLFHLYPTDGFVNGKRSNYPYGEVGQTDWTSENGSKLGNCSWSGYSGTVFEPIDSYKGDFARTYFYMSVRYYTEDSGWPGSDMVTGSQLKSWALALMLHWNDMDPVSQKEIDRNNAVYEIQNNRNPFIDHPEFAENIWVSGSGVGERNTDRELTVYPNPAEYQCYIDLPACLTKKKVELAVYEAAGRKAVCTYVSDGNRIRLEPGKLSSGIYFIRITSPSESGSYGCLLLKK